MTRTLHDSTGSLVLFRKGNAPASMSLEELATLIARKVQLGEIRKPRTELVALLLATQPGATKRAKERPSVLASLPVVTQREIDVPAGARKLMEAGKGFTLPEMKGIKVCKSQADGLKNRLVANFGLDPESFTIAYVK